MNVLVCGKNVIFNIAIVVATDSCNAIKHFRKPAITITTVTWCMLIQKIKSSSSILQSQ